MAADIPFSLVSTSGLPSHAPGVLLLGLLDQTLSATSELSIPNSHPPKTRTPFHPATRRVRQTARSHAQPVTRPREVAADRRASADDDPGGGEDPDPALVAALADAVVRHLKKLLPAGFLADPDQPPQTRPPAPEWLTATEAARYLGFKTVKAFYSAAERGQVPHSRIGRRLRFSRAGLDRLLERRAAKMEARVPSPGKESERW